MNMNMTTAPDADFISNGHATKLLWLFMAREGGRWNGKELRQAIPQIDGAHVSGILSNMYDANQITRTGESGAFQYGVSGTCCVPRHVTVNELYQALVLDRKESLDGSA